MPALKIRGPVTAPDQDMCHKALLAVEAVYGKLDIEWLGNGGYAVESNDIPPYKMRKFAKAIKSALGVNYKVTLTATF